MSALTIMSQWFVVDSEGRLSRSPASDMRPMNPVAKILNEEVTKETLDLLEEAIFSHGTVYVEKFFAVYKREREISDKQQDLESVRVALSFLEGETPERPPKLSWKDREFNTFLRDLVTTRYSALKHCYMTLGWRPTVNGLRVYEYDGTKPYAFSTPAKTGDD